MINIEIGTQLIQIGKSNDYYLVALPVGDVGYIHQDFVRNIIEKTLSMKERAYLRYGPSIEYNVVEVLEKGSKITLLGEKNGWYEVRSPMGATGWIYKDFVNA